MTRFHTVKPIDNSRLVREADPRARGACWSAIGVACVTLALLGTVLAPSVAGTLAGYKLESLRAEERTLLSEQRLLDEKEAELLRPYIEGEMLRAITTYEKKYRMKLDRPVQVGCRLNVNGDMIRASFGEIGDIALGLDDHQVAIEG